MTFDTFAASTPGASENSSEDMTAAIANAQKVRDAMNVSVRIIHHSNGSGTRERGHSAMRGAADTMIALTPVDDGHHRQGREAGPAMNATINRIVRHLHQLESLDPKALDAVEMLVKDAIDLRTEQPRKRGLASLVDRLQAAHPGCTGGFIQQPPHSGRRSWKCGGCGKLVTLPEGG